MGAMAVGFSLGRRPGRPRERWHVTDYPWRIDANEIRRMALAEGRDLGALRAVCLPRAGAEEEAGETIRVEVVRDGRYGWRLWLLCPRCGSRRVHLYPVRVGPRCRKCARNGYGLRQ